MVRGLSRDHSVVVFGSALAGLGAFAYVLLATRNLGLQDFKPISQLWTVWAIAAAVVTFSGQIVTVRREVFLGKVAIPQAAEFLPLLLLVLVVVPVVFVYRVRIFGEANLVWPAVATLIPFGSFVTGRARGWSAVHGSPAQLAAVVGGENLVRATIAVALGLLHAQAIWYGLAILAGYSVALVGLFRRSNVRRPEDVIPETTERLFPLSASTAGICCHVLLVAAPTVLATAGGDARVVSALFVALAVFRAPYQLVLGVIPIVARTFNVELSRSSGAYVKRQVGRIAIAVISLAGLAAVVGAMFGERIVAPIFGAEGVLNSSAFSLAGALTVVATGALLGSVALLARARTVWVMSVWAVITVLTLVCAFVVQADPTAILTVMLVGLLAAMIGMATPLFRSGDVTGQRE